MEFNGALYDRIYRAKPYAREIERVAAHLSGTTVLDIGGGTGNHALFLKKKGYEPLVFDFSDSMLAEATRKGLPVKKGNIEQKPTDEKYDSAVALFHVLNFCKKMHLALANIHASLKTGGTLVFDLWDPTVKKQGFAFIPDGVASRFTYKRWRGNEVLIVMLFPLFFRFEVNRLYCPDADLVTHLMKEAGFSVEQRESDGLNIFFVAKAL